MIDLQEKYGNTYKIYRDESYRDDLTDERKKAWQYHEIRGKEGFVYNYSENQLAVFFQTTNRRIGKFKRKYAREWTMKADADGEAIFLFPETDIKLIFDLIQPKKRRIVTNGLQ